jgi:hypothetical protein
MPNAGGAFLDRLDFRFVRPTQKTLNRDPRAAFTSSSDVLRQ